MFAVHCPRHGKRVLLTTDDITAVHHTNTGITVAWECFCGERGTWRVKRARQRD
jgi:hypothetical protein